MILQKTKIIKNGLTLIRKSIDSLTKRLMPARVHANFYIGHCIRAAVDSGMKKKDAISKYSSLCEKCFGRKSGFSKSNTRRKLRFYVACCKHEGLLQKALIAGWTITSILISRFKNYDVIEYYLDLCIREVLTERDLTGLLCETDNFSNFHEKSQKTISGKQEPEVFGFVKNSAGHDIKKNPEFVIPDKSYDEEPESADICVREKCAISNPETELICHIRNLKFILDADSFNQILLLFSLFCREIILQKSSQ